MPLYDSVIPCCLRSGRARILRAGTNLLLAALDSDTEEKNISDRTGQGIVELHQIFLNNFSSAPHCHHRMKSLCSGKCETVKLYNLKAMCWLGNDKCQWRIW